MRTRRARAAITGCALASLAVAAAGCGASGGGGTSKGTAPPARTLAPTASVSQPDSASADAGAGWPTFGRNAARTGVAAGVAGAGPLRVAWRASLDGAVYGQPLLVGRLVIAATENDSIYGLSPATGAVAWRTHIGTPVPLADLPCGDIDPLGITGTPVYDVGNGLIYAVAETSGYHHVLVGVSATDGAIRVERDIPAPDGQPRYDQQRPALAVEDGRVYVAFGGLYGDCGPYRGSVVGVPVSGTGPIISYLVPTAREGAVWGTAGPVAGPAGTLYVSVGNGSVTSTSFDGSDSVTALSPALRRVAIFAPGTWYADSQGDLDLGSAQPVLFGNGMLLALGKSGTAYLLRSDRLGGVGGQVAQASVCPAYGAASVAGSTAYEPCAQGGMAAVSVADGQIRVQWRGPASAQGSPVVGGGAVWVTDYAAGTLYELNPATGATRYSLSLGIVLPHFASLSMTGSRAFLGTDEGVLAVSGALRARGPAGAGRLGAMAPAMNYIESPTPAFLFDLDGTLIDSVYQHVIAWRTALSGIGIDLSVWRIHRRIGMSGGLFVSALLRETGRSLSKADIDRLQQAHAAEYRTQVDSVTALPGARELLGALTDAGVRWAIATSGYAATARPALALLGLPEDTPMVTRDLVRHAKPDPDLFLAAAAELGVEPKDAMVVGDSVWDLLAARRAGALGVGLMSGGYGREELERAGAYRVYADPAEMLARIDELGVRTDQS
jgi:HAD superfamily hydrolase (TIGR01509 family)